MIYSSISWIKSLTRISFLTLGNRKKSHGARSGLFGWFPSKLNPFDSRNETVIPALWAGALSWWNRIPLHPFFGHSPGIFQPPLGKLVFVYQSAVTVDWLATWTVARWLLLVKKLATIFFWKLRLWRNFNGLGAPFGNHWLHCCFVSGSNM